MPVKLFEIERADTAPTNGIFVDVQVSAKSDRRRRIYEFGKTALGQLAIGFVEIAGSHLAIGFDDRRHPGCVALLLRKSRIPIYRSIVLNNA